MSLSCLSSAKLLDLISPMACRLPMSDSDISIREVVSAILHCAQTFVPCEAGSVMLSHPDQSGALVFVASFGAGSEKLPGTVLPAATGFAGQAYSTGKPFITNSPTNNHQFYQDIDKLTDHSTKSLLCLPLLAYGQSVGVLSLLNRIGGSFCQQDLELLDVFCHYLTQSIQVLLEAKRQREAAFKDHLTGLHNDRFLYSYIAEAIAEAEEEGYDVGLMFLDLDHFKAVVDTHGHLVGSQALRECGYLIGKIAEKYKAVPSRYGGDEYVLVLPKCERDKLSAMAEEIRQQVECAVFVCEGEGTTPIILDRRVTSSIGLACVSQVEVEERTPERLRQHLIRVADVAMYDAKALGKNRVHWHGDPRPETRAVGR